MESMHSKARLPLVLSGILILGLIAGLVAESGTEDKSPLVEAVQQGDSQKVESLLRSGENPNVTTQDGYTLLMLASAAGGTDMVKMLLDYGAYPNTQTDNGLTAVAIAAGSVAEEESVNATVEKLLEFGADPNPFDSPMSPVAFAMLRDHASVVALLEEHGAFIKQTEVYAVLSAQQALVRSSKASIRELVEMKSMPTREDYLENASEVAWEPYRSTMQSAGYPVGELDKQEFLSGLKNVYDSEKLSRLSMPVQGRVAK